MQLRDQGIVRQRWDFSCGLASLATLLTYYYRAETAERDLLERLTRLRGVADETAAWGEQGVSLADLRLLARERGLDALGMRVSLQSLMTLRRPVVLYLEPRGSPHFAVLRGIDSDGNVLLADPSAGNRRLSREHFARWFTPGDSDKGIILLLSAGLEGPPDESYFSFRPLQPRLAPPALLR